MTDSYITWQPTAPYTPAQDLAERAGALIIIVARAFRIFAGLPHNLWPECVCAAAYLLNRTPIEAKQWKTPFELITKHKPNLAHLRIYGCRAYPLINNIMRSAKLEPRCHIGYLVGWEGNNIFRIWIPSQHEVVRTRDVTFDETQFYHPGEVDLGHALREEVLQVIPMLSPAPPMIQQELLDAAQQTNLDLMLDERIPTTTTAQGVPQAPPPAEMEPSSPTVRQGPISPPDAPAEHLQTPGSVSI